MPHSRVMPTIGPRCHELRIVDADATWRIIYRVDSNTIVMADVFAKKWRTTPLLQTPGIWRGGTPQQMARKKTGHGFARMNAGANLCGSVSNYLLRKAGSTSSFQSASADTAQTPRLPGEGRSVSLDLIIRSLLALRVSSRGIMRAIAKPRSIPAT